MKLTNKQPIFEAEQFDGSEASAQRLHHLIGQHNVESRTLTTPTLGKAQIVFKVYGNDTITLTAGEWLLCAPDGTRTVVDDGDLEAKFDKAPPTLGALRIGDQGTIVGFGNASSGVDRNGWYNGKIC